MELLSYKTKTFELAPRMRNIHTHRCKIRERLKRSKMQGRGQYSDIQVAPDARGDGSLAIL